jgi:hypothetical protein
VAQLETDRSRIATTAPGPDLPGLRRLPESAGKPLPWQRRLGGCLVILVAFLGAVTLGLLLAAAWLASRWPSCASLHRLAGRSRDLVLMLVTL